MKKTLYTLLALASCGFFAASVNAASGDYVRNAGTGQIQIDATSMIAAGQTTTNMTFQPSANVFMTGQSSATSFAHAAYHTQTEDKTNGRQFAMAADINVIYWANISDDAAAIAPLTAIAGTTSAAFPLANWTTM